MRRSMVVAALVAVVLVWVLASASSQAATQGRWVMTDLGTLGRDYSEAVGINERGDVIGKSWDGGNAWDDYGSRKRAFLWQDGRERDLGSLGGQTSYAHDINEKGQIVGEASTKGGNLHAFLWQNGKMRDLGTLGGKESDAVAINERGQVVGQADTKATDKYAGGPIEHAFLWQNGTMRDLGSLGTNGGVVAINRRGQVLGYVESNAKNGDRLWNAFLWEKGRRIEIGRLPVAINERGQVVGYNGYGSRGFLWQNGTKRDLGTLRGQDDSQPLDINNRGQVVGASGDHAFLWEKGRMRDIGDFEALAINDKGQIVGGSGGYFGGEAFLWQNGKMTSLPAPRKLVPYAKAISERGQIIGYTDPGDCHVMCPRAVLWTYKP